LEHCVCAEVARVRIGLGVSELFPQQAASEALKRDAVAPLDQLVQ
jgi:hypothetical protein